MTVIFTTIKEIEDSVLSCRPTGKSLSYVEGKLPPHYPVPVIRYVAVHHVDSIALFRLTGEGAIFEYMF